MGLLAAPLLLICITFFSWTGRDSRYPRWAWGLASLAVWVFGTAIMGTVWGGIIGQVLLFVAATVGRTHVAAQEVEQFRDDLIEKYRDRDTVGQKMVGIQKEDEEENTPEFSRMVIGYRKPDLRVEREDDGKK